MFVPDALRSASLCCAATADAVAVAGGSDAGQTGVIGSLSTAAGHLIHCGT